MTQDYRQRFFIEQSPVRGDIVRLHEAYQKIIQQKPYPVALQHLLGEMLVGASLLTGTLKIEGRLSIQLQAQGDSHLLAWAMAECDHTGAVRALANFHEHDDWQSLHCSDEAFAQMGQSVLFINIHNATGDSYQGIVEQVSHNLAECLTHYQKQSAQIPTFIQLATTTTHAGGILIQLLPQSNSDKESDPDLWNRISTLASTLKKDELTDLPANEILYRLYHEEQVVAPEPSPLHFGCTCSLDKSQSVIIGLGRDKAVDLVHELGELSLDCDFCGAVYHFDLSTINALFD